MGGALSAARRPWFCSIQYPDLKPIYFGTVWANLNDGHERIRQLLEAAALESLPPGFNIIEMVPGQIIIVPAGEDE